MAVMASPVLVALVAVTSSVLGEATPISLREAVSAAIGRNPTLGVSAADRIAAEGRARSAAGIDDFVIDAALNWVESRKTLDPSDPLQVPALDQIDASLSVTRYLPSGGRVALRLSHEFAATTFSTLEDGKEISRSLSRIHLPALRLTVAHPLLRGLGVRVARAGLRRARVQGNVASLQRQAALLDILRQVVIGYWELLYAQEELAIRQTAAQAARDQLAVVRANIDTGKLPASASAEVEVTIALRDEEAQLAEQTLADRSLELRRLAFLDIGPDQILLRATVDLEALPELPSMAEIAETLRQRNPELAAARTQQETSIVDLDVARNGLLPQLDLTVSGGPSGFSPDAATAYSQLGRFNSYSVDAALVFQYPIRQRLARGAYQAAGGALRSAQLRVSEVQAQLLARLGRMLAAAVTARQRIDILAPATAAANLDLEAQRARFAVGRATNFDVLRRQQGLALAQLHQVRARVDYLDALAAIEALTGDILDRFGVTLR